MGRRYPTLMTRTRFTSLLAALATALPLTTPAAGQVLSNDVSDVVNVTLLSGWRSGDGTHFAALKFSMAPGWKTYWRAPGDGGVPTRMDWSASGNLDAARVLWPTPQVFRQNGLRSVGYSGDFVLPVAFTAHDDGPIALDGQLEFGVCSEICLPVSLDLATLLPPNETHNVEEIATAIQKQPITAAQAGVRHVECTISYGDKRARIDMQIDMPPLQGNGEAMVLEVADPRLWVGEPFLTRSGDTLRATAELAARGGTPFRVDMDRVRMTIITTQNAVEIVGCA